MLRAGFATQRADILLREAPAFKPRLELWL